MINYFICGKPIEVDTEKDNLQKSLQSLKVGLNKSTADAIAAADEIFRSMAPQMDEEEIANDEEEFEQQMLRLS
jgi:hypothetical protein